MSGTLYDTYVAALQHDLAEVPPDARLIGVVRRPTPWVYGVVDENVTSLGPPDSLLAEFKARHEERVDAGEDDATAHNAAMDDVSYDERYREYLDASAAAQEAIAAIRERLDAGADVVLVCFENTAQKRCHRTLLKDRIVR